MLNEEETKQILGQILHWKDSGKNERTLWHPDSPSDGERVKYPFHVLQTPLAP